MITCYLDSQDYSTLADKKLENEERRQIKDALRHLAETNQVKFSFSEIVICESISLKEETSHLAEMRADFISELCGSNALVSVDRLVDKELKSLADRVEAPAEMFDLRGRWFPEFSIANFPTKQRVELGETVNQGLQEQGLSRQQRRANARAVEKNKKSQNFLLIENEFLEKYPMPADCAEVMTRYALGQATRDEYHEAFMIGLSDPRWAMKWFTTQHSNSSSIAEIVRGPARRIGQNLRFMIEAARIAALKLQESGQKNDATGKKLDMISIWNANTAREIVAIPRKMAISKQMILAEGYTASDVDRFCPGLSTAARSLFSSVWANVSDSQKKDPSDSQSVDAFHAYYAPYVNVFRADRFMAPHIQKHVQKSGTAVVSQLSKLVAALDERLH